MTPTLGVVAAGLLLMAACAARADAPPEIVVDRTACAHCGMLVSERIYAAASQASGAEAQVFDDVACLLAARAADGRRVWVHDAGTGEWIDGAAAVFVAAPSIRSPMGGGVLAFAARADADRAAAAHGGEVVPTLARLIARKGGRQ